MKKDIKKFLEFNGKTIYFAAADGQYWIAIKPICEALNVDYIRQFKNLQIDKILGELLSEQTMVAADGKLRKMVLSATIEEPACSIPQPTWIKKRAFMERLHEL